MEIRFNQILLLILLMAALAACSKPMLNKPLQPASDEKAAAENPRAMAALQLTDQGRRLLEDHQPDKAIRLLEQAVSLNPLNGQNYYYLAEAWLMKGAIDQAKEFNQLAGMHLKDDSEWLMRVAKQANQIAELEQ
jgi:tetratricopeptide (TPR) repeat protein